MFFKHLFQVFLEKFYVRELKSFFVWLRERGISNISITIDLPLQKKNLVIGEGNQTENIPDFFITNDNSELVKLLTNNHLPISEVWEDIFKTPHFRIIERKSRYKNGKYPYYFLLTQEERDEVVRVARVVLDQVLEKKDITVDSFLKDHFLEISTELDIGFWVRGQMRGSVIVKGSTFLSTVIQGVVATCSDRRFKPLTLEDRDELQIEVTLLSGLHIPVSKKELSSNAMYHNKSYLLTVESKKTWFLPMAFNTFSFESLLHIIRELHKKGNLPYKDSNTVYLVETQNFIEKAPKEKSTTLNGPILDTRNGERTSLETVMAKAELAALSLHKALQQDGFLPTIIKVRDITVSSNMDMTRFIFTVYAAALWGTVSDNSKTRDLVNSSYCYIVQTIFDHYNIKSLDLLFLVYYLRLLKVLNRKDFLVRVEKELFSRLEKVPYDSILYLQVAHYCVETSEEDSYRFSKAITLVKHVVDMFNSKILHKETVSIAAYADLMPLLFLLGKETNDSALVNEYEKVCNWFFGYQLENGAFRSSNDSYHVYTRGVSKVLESMSLTLSLHDERFRRCLDWVLAMQYSKENMFFVEKEYKEKVLGGFRSDYHTADTWTDAVAHYLIAAYRLSLNENK